MIFSFCKVLFEPCFPVSAYFFLTALKNPSQKDQLGTLPGIIFSVMSYCLFRQYCLNFLRMCARWILFFLMAFAITDGFSQFNERTNSQLRWNGLGFIKSTRHIKGPDANCGIYSTAEDRAAGKLSIAINCRVEDHKMKIGFVREKSAIRIERKDESHSFLHSDLYGYRDCDGNEFHFYDGRRYELMNPGEPVAIYRVFEPKGKRRVARFVFTFESDDLKPLTLKSFNDMFSDEPLFLEKLHMLARNNFELVKYHSLINRVRANAVQESETTRSTANSDQNNL